MGNYSSELPIWLAEGVKPPENMLKVGWKASQKPPADYFNWFFNRTHVALSELQEKTATEKNVTLHTSNKSNPHSVTAAQVGLGEVINQKQATKAEFDTHNIDTTKHITTAERTKWNAKAETTSNVASATKLLNARQINGVAFDGTKDITVLSNPLTTSLKENDDLNNYKTPGQYFCKADSTVPTLKNCPVTNAFSLFVKYHSGVHQEVVTYTTSNFQKWVRNYYEYTNTWGSWVKDPLCDGTLQTGLYAQTASKLSTARNIAGIPFDGTASITIPAGNVGAYTKEEADAKINQRQKNLDAHTSNKSNPHSVTAAQLGAVTLTGSQTISGDKNFTGALKVKGVSIVDLIYPVGAVYQSTKSTSPNTLFGGTWERIKGKVLVGVDESDTDFSTVNKTGGAKTHKLSDGELPAKNGIIAFHGAGGSGTVVERCSGVFTGTSLISNKYHTNQSTSGGNSYGGVNFDLGGKNESHNNMQPYITVYMWVRTA